MTKQILTYILFIFCFTLRGQVTDGLVSKYSFTDGSIKDDKGKNNAKAYGVTPASDRFGNSQSAFYLQGNPDSYINLGTSNSLKPKSASISIWVKIDQEVMKGKGFDGNPIIFTKSHIEDDFTEGYSIMYHIGLRKLHCNAAVSEVNQVVVYPLEVTYLRRWYHVVMTYDSKSIALYLDGVLQGHAAKNYENEFLEGDSVMVGAWNGPKNKRFLQGSVDDIRIYNRALSPKEVLELYNEPNPNKFSVIRNWILISLCGLLFILLIIWIIKWRIAKAISIEKEKNQLRNNWYEQENKVLMAQMDPHFIFNSLNTIQQFIIINDNEKAQLYLTKFSRLLRMILENNVKESISLKEEIDIAEKYLEIESLRFNNVFKYSISFERDIDPTQVFIPRFLIQPFIENAIWHGLLPKDGDKQLYISFAIVKDKALCCIIDDNGIGRKNSQKKEAINNNRSLAINFIQQRLQLMSKIYKEEYGIEIIDKTDASGKSEGTKIIAIIPILKN